MIYFGFLLLACLIFILQSYIFNRFALRHIEYERKFSQVSCFCGEEVEMTEQIANRKRLPVPWLRAESQMPASLRFGKQDNLFVSSGQVYQNHRSLFSLKPNIKITRRHKITAVRRGVYRLQTVTLTSGDLLAMNARHKQILLDGTLTVYPRIVDVPWQQLPFRSWQGEQSVLRWIIPDPFVMAGVRAYEPGDSIRSVNWKATAKVGALQVHKYDYTADRQLMIYLNADDDEMMWRTVNNETLIEQGIEWAASLAAAVIGQGQYAGFATNLKCESGTACLEPAGGQEQMQALLELMAHLQLERNEPFVELLYAVIHDKSTNHDIVVISAYWNDELEQIADQLRYQGNSLTLWPLEKEGKQ